jgi:hypothetical protein
MLLQSQIRPKSVFVAVEVAVGCRNEINQSH